MDERKTRKADGVVDDHRCRSCCMPCLCNCVWPLLQTDWGSTGQATPTTSNFPGVSSRHPVILAMPYAPPCRFPVSCTCTTEPANYIPPDEIVSSGSTIAPFCKLCHLLILLHDATYYFNGVFLLLRTSRINSLHFLQGGGRASAIPCLPS